MITSSATAVADQQCTPGGIQDRKQDEVLSALVRCLSQEESS